MPALARQLAGRTWQVVRFPAPVLLTSDTPVVLWTPSAAAKLYQVGLGSAHEVRVPLDARHALIVARRAPAGEILRDLGERQARALNRTVAEGAVQRDHAGGTAVGQLKHGRERVVDAGRSPVLVEAVGAVPDGVGDEMPPVAVPEEAQMEVGGLDLLPDGRPIVCTRRGDVWIVGDAGQLPPVAPKLELFASGLQEPLGVAVRPDPRAKSGVAIWLAQRCELTRLVDLDGDEKADLFETVCDGWQLSGNYHEYAFGPRFDPDGIPVQTGGTVSEVRDVMAGADRIWNEIGYYYLLTYTPPRQGREVYKIDVRVSRPNVTVRERRMRG